jgi:hypothetical protein
MKKLQAAVLLVVWLAGPVAAQDFVTDVSNNGTVSAAFLEIGVGARAEAMGGAYASEAGRAEMIYWNPAGLAYLDGLSTTFTHTEWLADLTFDFFALAVPLPFFNTVLGTSFTTLGTPEQPVRTEFEPEGTGEVYDARDFAACGARRRGTRHGSGDRCGSCHRRRRGRRSGRGRRRPGPPPQTPPAAPTGPPAAGPLPPMPARSISPAPLRALPEGNASRPERFLPAWTSAARHDCQDRRQPRIVAG